MSDSTHPAASLKALAQGWDFHSHSNDPLAPPPPYSSLPAGAKASEASLSESGPVVAPVVHGLLHEPSADARRTSAPANPSKDVVYPWSQRALHYLPVSLVPSTSSDSQHPNAPPNTSVLKELSSPAPFPRYGHSVNSLAIGSSGDLYIFGGLVNGRTCNDLYVLQCTPNSALSIQAARERGEKILPPPNSINVGLVETKGEIPSPRLGHASVGVGNVLVIWGGDTTEEGEDEPDSNDDALYLLNLSCRDWTRVKIDGPAPEGRYGHAVAMVGSCLYVFGGQSSNTSFFNDLWSFDLQNLKVGDASWTQIQPNTIVTKATPSQRTGHTLVTYKDNFYIFGGTDGQYHYNDTWEYNTQTGQWSELSCSGFIPVAREGHAATVVDDFMYVFGGRGVDGKDLEDLTAFKITGAENVAGRWFMFQHMGPTPSGRCGHAMAAWQSKVYVLGGESYSNPQSGYDPNYINIMDSVKINFPQLEEGQSATQSANQRMPSLKHSHAASLQKLQARMPPQQKKQAPAVDTSNEQEEFRKQAVSPPLLQARNSIMTSNTVDSTPNNQRLAAVQDTGSAPSGASVTHMLLYSSANEEVLRTAQREGDLVFLPDEKPQTTELIFQYRSHNVPSTLHVYMQPSRARQWLADNCRELEKDAVSLGVKFLHASIGPDPRPDGTPSTAAELIVVYADLSPSSATFCRNVATYSKFPVRLRHPCRIPTLGSSNESSGAGWTAEKESSARDGESDSRNSTLATRPNIVCFTSSGGQSSPTPSASSPGIAPTSTSNTSGSSGHDVSAASTGSFATPSTATSSLHNPALLPRKVHRSLVTLQTCADGSEDTTIESLVSLMVTEVDRAQGFLGIPPRYQLAVETMTCIEGLARVEESYVRVQAVDKSPDRDFMDEIKCFPRCAKGSTEQAHQVNAKSSATMQFCASASPQATFGLSTERGTVDDRKVAKTDVPPYAVMEADATRMSKTFWVCADPDADKVNPSLHKSCTVLLPTDLHVSQYYPELSGNEYPYLQLSVYTQVQCYHFGTSKIGFDGYMSATLHKFVVPRILDPEAATDIRFTGQLELDTSDAHETARRTKGCGVQNHCLMSTAKESPSFAASPRFWETVWEKVKPRAGPTSPATPKNPAWKEGPVVQADLDSVLLRGDPSCVLVRTDDMRLNMVNIDSSLNFKLGQSIAYRSFAQHDPKQKK